ncbi:MAG: GNAT family N-acetyltransferase [Candidatus Bathyarchaeota archaeon]
MIEVRPVRSEEFDEYARMILDAYPAMFSDVTEERRQGWVERMRKTNQEEGPVKHYGCYRGGAMVGGMRLHDFYMTVYESKVFTGGVGNVFVDLTRKKEHVSKDMMKWFHRHYLERGAALAVLYPFRPDFYRRMGYGYGRKMNKYRFRPVDLPRGDKDHVDWMKDDDAPLLLECYNRYAHATHGMIEKQLPYFERMLKRSKVVGYMRGGEVEGFLAFGFKKLDPDHMLLQDIEVQTLIYLNREALLGLLAFLRTQQDQVERVVLCTMDDDLHFIMDDPRDGEPHIFYTSQETNVQGVGIMYRVLDTRGLLRQLENHSFGGVDLRLRLNVVDTFLPDNHGSTLVHFTGGKPKVVDKGGFDVELALSVEWLSSLIMGVVDLRKLWAYGLVEVSDASYLETLDAAFRTHVKPVTIEEF